LYGNFGAYGDDGRGFAAWDNHVTSFTFAAAGSAWAGNLVDFHVDWNSNRTLYVNVGAYGNDGRGFAGLANGVKSFAFGFLESAPYLIVLTTSGVLEGNSGNGFQSWVTGVKEFRLDPQTGAIIYTLMNGK
jgi:hypothetical protein